MDKPWQHTIRRETGLIENICGHGTGHPAAASVHWAKINGNECMGVHGCCGCCQTPEWKLADATAGYEKANELLLALMKRHRLLAFELLKLKGAQENDRGQSKEGG
jgi:hypothetical protein